VASVLSSMRATTGTPMLPPTRVGRPAAVRISPSSVVVVVLPLEAGDGEGAAFEEAGGQLQLSDDGQAEAADLSQFGGCRGGRRARRRSGLESGRWSRPWPADTTTPNPQLHIQTSHYENPHRYTKNN